jgi:hypothetical protein
MPSTVTVGSKIQALSNVDLNVELVKNNALNARYQGARTSTSVQCTSEWRSQIAFQIVVDFSTSDSARYFFNTGGQLKLGFSHAPGNAVSTMFQKLLSLNNGIGELYFSAPASGTAVIASNTFTGLTRASATVDPNGMAVPTVFKKEAGYYGLVTSDVEIFRLPASSLAVGDRVAGFENSYISIFARSTSQTTNRGDNGSVATFTVMLVQVASSTATLQTLPPGATVTVTTINPSTRFLQSQQWVSPTVTTSYNVN